MTDPRDRDRKAMDARRVLSEPIFDEIFDGLERDAMEEALTVPTWRPWGNKKRDALLQRVHVIRDLRTSLKTLIAIGDQAAKRAS
jgi:hypothetical protein